MKPYQKRQHLTFIEWLKECINPGHTHKLLIGGDILPVMPSHFFREERQQRRSAYIVECPESNCRILVSGNGGDKKSKKLATWLPNKN